MLYESINTDDIVTKMKKKIKVHVYIWDDTSPHQVDYVMQLILDGTQWTQN